MKIRIVSSFVLTTILIMALLIGVSELPEFGSADAPAHNEVMVGYNENSIEETHSYNVVTAIILDYRGFDTLIEATVLFCTVIIILVTLNGRKNHWMKSLILKEVNRFTVIIIYLFGLYVILHGHLSPGGGFAGGTIISAGMVLYKLLYSKRAKEVIHKKLLMTTISGAIILYGLLKAYHIFHGILGHANHGGEAVPYAIYSAGSLLVLNLCVGVIVACAFYTIASLFMEGEL